jgi:predicted acylesterase/phospholipase RssA
MADTPGQIGIALSGGGHRATVWGIGALLAVAEAGLNPHVVSISSVSGGSIANGVAAHGPDYRTSTAAEIRASMRPCLRVIAHEGLFFLGPKTNGYIGRLFLIAGLGLVAVLTALTGALAAARGWEAGWFLLASAAGIVAAAITLRTLPRSFWSALLIPALILGPALYGAVALVADRDGGAAVLWVAVLVVVAALFLALAMRTFGRRGLVVDRALAATLLSDGSGAATKLRDVDRGVHHVFCATELQAGDHCYLTPRLVYSYQAGRSAPGSLDLATAVQCSACLPGAFPPRRIETIDNGLDLSIDWPLDGGAGRAPTRWLLLNDGGVYDNMADQWEQGYDERAERLDLPTDGGADELVVVNAGKAMGWQTLSLGPIRREVVGLTRTIDILYDVSTSHRRNALVRRFGSSDALGLRRELRGALVHIAQSPFQIPRRFLHAPDASQRDRAAQAIKFLDNIGADPGAWERQADANARVKTTLGALGPTVTADLLEHAYLLTRVNLYVILGRGSLEGAEADCARSRFEDLVRELTIGDAA